MRQKTNKERKLTTIVQRNVVFCILKTPGPGAYNNEPQLNTQGVYANSQFQRIAVPKFKLQCYNGPEQKLGRVPIHKKPGPGAYETRAINLYDSLVTQNSRLGTSAAVAQFGSSERLTYFKSKSFTPGPGEYLAPSAFGQYISKEAAAQSLEISKKF